MLKNPETLRVVANPFVFAAMAAAALFASATPARCAAPAPASLPLSPRFFPAPGEKAACPDSPMKLTFTAPPTLGTGKIQIFDAATDTLVEAIDVATPTKSQAIGGQTPNNYYPVTINGNEAAIHFKNHALAYAKSYYLTADPTVFKVATPFAGVTGKEEWKFSTRPAAPKAGTTKLTVAADGSGDFCTVQAALDFIPDANTTPTNIFIKKGTYTEMIFLRNKSAVTLVGEDRKQSIIAYANNSRANQKRSVMQINNCNDFVMANLTVWNTTPKMSGGNQAECIIYGGPLTTRAVLNKVDLKSFQDTLQINDQAYLSDCYIEGDIDFMWGTGPVFFENVTCKMLTSNDSFVETRNPASNHGFIYYHCNFQATEGLTGNYLAQSVGNCEVALIDCVLPDSVRPLGWRVNNAGGARGGGGRAGGGGGGGGGVRYIEFNSHHADGKPVDMSQRAPESRELKQPADAQMIADYSNPTTILGNNWIPMTPRPTTVSIKANAAASFSATAGFAPDTTWQWQKNGTDIPGATNPVYAIKQFAPADAGDYTLIAKSDSKTTTTAAATVKLAE